MLFDSEFSKEGCECKGKKKNCCEECDCEQQESEEISKEEASAIIRFISKYFRRKKEV